MGSIVPLADRLAPDSIRLLERGAKQRLDDAAYLSADGRLLLAIYLLGYAVEMCLCAAYFRSVGFAPNTPIDRETRKRRMTQRGRFRRPMASH